MAAPARPDDEHAHPVARRKALVVVVVTGEDDVGPTARQCAPEAASVTSLPWRPELNRGWCIAATVHGTGCAARSRGASRSCGEPAPQPPAGPQFELRTTTCQPASSKLYQPRGGAVLAPVAEVAGGARRPVLVVADRRAGARAVSAPARRGSGGTRRRSRARRPSPRGRRSCPGARRAAERSPRRRSSHRRRRRRLRSAAERSRPGRTPTERRERRRPRPRARARASPQGRAATGTGLDPRA